MIRSVSRWWGRQRMRWSRFWSSLSFGRLSRRFSSVLEWLWYVAKLPFVLAIRFVYAIWSAMVAAWTQKHIRYFLQGLPALIVILGVCVTSAFAYLRANEGLVDLYSREGLIAQAGQNVPKARLCYERLAQLNPRDSETRYNLAVTLMADNQREYANSLMQELAPMDRSGYALAHLWEARRLLLGGQLSQEVVKNAEIQLTRALNPATVPPLREDKAVEAKGLLGRLYLATNREAEAEPYLVSAASQLPDLRLLLADIYRRRGREDLARDQCRMAAAYFGSLARANVDFVQARVQWARALYKLGDYKQAAETLEEGLRLSADEGYRLALSDVYVNWAIDARRKNPDALPEYLSHLQRAVLSHPGNPQAIGLLVDLTRVSTPESAKAKEQLRGLLAENSDNTLLHFAVGVLCYEENNLDLAYQHWENAYKKSYDMAIVGNNLAWSLATVEGRVDLPRALQIANGVIKANPNVPLFHGTRGYIHYRAGRFKEAVEDFEISLKDNQFNPELNVYLAECYDALGNKPMAEEHRKISNLKRQRLIEGAKPSKK